MVLNLRLCILEAQWMRLLAAVEAEAVVKAAVEEQWAVVLRSRIAASGFPWWHLSVFQSSVQLFRHDGIREATACKDGALTESDQLSDLNVR